MIGNRRFLQLFFACHPRLEACLVALILVIAAFPDVIFLGASMRLTDQVAGAEHHYSQRPFYPVASPDRWWGSYSDNGGSVFQSEPMAEFMRRTIQAGDSPYWNPYSAAGALGPEALVDEKFSALTLFNALLGGSSEAYNCTLVALYFFALFFLYRLIRERLKLSVVAGIGSAVFYLLNGYSVANFGSNVTQNYLYIPMCIYASITFLGKPGASRLVGVALAFIPLLSCTFAPTTAISFLAIYALLIGYIFSRVAQRQISYKSAMGLLIAQGLAVGLSVFFLSYLYLPILENISSIGTLGDYAKRDYWPLHYPAAIPALLSTSLFFESYNAMEIGARAWQGGRVPITGNAVFHLGIIAIAFAGCAISLRKNSFSPLILACTVCLLLALCRLFAIPPCRGLISHIPVIGKIGAQYWWSAIVLPVAILVGFGADNLQRNNARILPSFLILAASVFACISTYRIYGFGESDFGYKVLTSLVLSVLLTIVIALLLLLRWNKNTVLAGAIVFSLVVAMFAELTLDGKMIRFRRSEAFAEPAPALVYVRDNVGLYRTINFGQTGLYPELGSALQVQEITSINQGVLSSYQDYFYAAIKLDESQRMGFIPAIPRGQFPTLLLIKDIPASNIIDWPALDLLGVKYVLLPANFNNYREALIRQGMRIVFETAATLVLENPNVLPRAFSIAMESVVEERGDQDPSIILPAAYRSNLHSQTISSYQNALVTIQGNVQEESLVVISDNWHKNWRARVNGKNTAIVRVNGTFRGVVVPAGDYVVEMNYRPRTLSIAIGMSIITSLLLLFMLGFHGRLDGAIQRRWKGWA